MIIQLALDRLSMEEAISITKLVESEIDWIEVGTSLIKEFGMNSVREIKKAFPKKTVVADTKTMDNAAYELEISFGAGADIVTVMGTAPKVTIETCLKIAKSHQKKIIIDLLNTSRDQVQALQVFEDAIFCEHISKDEQEMLGNSTSLANYHLLGKDLLSPRTIAVAGGINIETFPQLCLTNASVAIIGSSITKAKDPKHAAKSFKSFAIQGGVTL